MAVITIIIIELNILVSFRVIKERGRERERKLGTTKMKLILKTCI